MQATPEQQAIVREIADKNVRVVAVAGCGKTTTNLFLAQGHPQKKILLLTYNANLRLETTEKVQRMGISNLCVHTFHSFAYHFYQKCLNDYGLYEIVLKNVRPVQEKAAELDFDILILDEMQDTTLLYYQFVCKIYKDNTHKDMRFCLLGDHHQTIYQFNGSDAGYFLNFHEAFPQNPWANCVLDTSFRCTRQVGDFLNKVMLRGQERIKTVKQGAPVHYIMCQSYENQVYEHIQNCRRMGYKYSDIFVLAPSVKTASSPVRILSETCSRHDIPVFVSYSDEDRPNARVLRNKLVFLTFHQAKGLERKVAFVLNFDESYFLFYKKEHNRDICPNELYVAVTRSSERLYVVHQTAYNFLPFLDRDLIRSHCLFTEKSLVLRKISNNTSSEISDWTPGSDSYAAKRDIRSVSVTDLVKRMSYVDLYDICNCLDIRHITPPGKLINVPTTIKVRHTPDTQGKSPPLKRARNTHYGDFGDCGGDNDDSDENIIYENVSDINAMVIMDTFEYLTNKDLFEKRCKNFDPKDIVHNTQRCAIDLCIANKYYFKLNQINDFGWINHRLLDRCQKRLAKLAVDREAEFEQEIKTLFSSDGTPCYIKGRIDCFDRKNNIIWEFKCVQVLDCEHIVQLSIYGYMVNHMIDPSSHPKCLRLFNVLDNHFCTVSIKDPGAFHRVLDRVVKRTLDRSNIWAPHSISKEFLSSFTE